ncbi:MAG: PQQ-dependent sugar dehydrogenase [Chloroflexota bacterium]
MIFQFSAHQILGLGLLIYGGLWGLYGLYTFTRGRDSRLNGIIIAGMGAAGIGVIAYLAASNSARLAYIDLDIRTLFRTFLAVAASVFFASISAYIMFRISRYLAGGKTVNREFIMFAALSILLVIGLGVLWLYLTTFRPDIDEVFSDVEGIEGIHIEENIPVKIFENHFVKAPTAMTLGADNILYVAGGQGSIWAIKDDNLDGVADSVMEFAADLKQPEGLAWAQGGLFVNENGQLSFLKDTNGDLKYDEKTVLIDNFPGEIYALHQNNGIAIGADGRLYIGSGATSDHRPEANPMAARIFSVNMDGSDLKVYATGVRNPFGIVPAPGGGFFAVDNGSSGCVDTDVQRDDCRPEVKIDVPEEVNYIIEGKDYGFPNYFGIPPEDSGTMPPIVTFPEHSAPSGIVLYDGDELPARFKGQLFVSLWARGEIYRVKLYRIDAEHYTGASLLFASGLTGPSALLNTPDGGLYIASYTGNAIYHVG